MKTNRSLVRAVARRGRRAWFFFWLCSAAVCVGLAAAALAQEPSQQTFHVKPLAPVAELRREALAARPPAQTGKRKSDLVELSLLDASLHFDLRYATANNFMGAPFYESARAFLQRPAAAFLLRVQRRLRAAGYGLLIYDAYRPWYVTKMFWDGTPGTPAEKRGFVADPQTGSRHNRGCAVDLGLYDLKTGAPAPMPSGYDEFSPRAAADYPGGTEQERARRDLLRRAMESGRFRVNPTEWWHFDYQGCDRYPVMNVGFEQIAR